MSWPNRFTRSSLNPPPPLSTLLNRWNFDVWPLQIDGSLPTDATCRNNSLTEPPHTRTNRAATHGGQCEQTFVFRNFSASSLIHLSGFRGPFFRCASLRLRYAIIILSLSGKPGKGFTMGQRNKQPVSGWRAFLREGPPCHYGTTTEGCTPNRVTAV